MELIPILKFHICLSEINFWVKIAEYQPQRNEQGVHVMKLKSVLFKENSSN